VTDRIKSGNVSLDAILGGGLPADAVNLVVGPPGSGKTMLVQQFVFANATAARPALYFSTVSEPLDKLVRYGQMLSFFDSRRVGSEVFYEDLGGVMDRRGLAAVLETIEESVRQRRPGMVVIDSFRALRAYAGEEEFRTFLHALASRASAFPASHFWVGEYTADDLTVAPEFAVADAIISMSGRDDGTRTARELEILKLRGSDFLSGRHAYRLASTGVDVFPRLADSLDNGTYEFSSERQSTGIAALDALLADGYLPGTSILVGGPTGAGKTLMGLHFIFNGLAEGVPGLFASLQEDKQQLARVAAGFGWSLDQPGVVLTHSSPVDVYIDEWVYQLLERAEQAGAKRIVVDSIDDLAFAIPDSVRFRECLYSLSRRCTRRGISLMLTLEVPDLFALDTIGRTHVSHLCDNVVLLQYVRAEESLKRAMTVLKARATRLNPQTREYQITDQGIVLGAPVTSLSH
jgi:circadian clock protein KaiC